MADLHRQRWGGAATACQLPSGGMVRGARCCLTPDAAVRVVPGRLLLSCLLLGSSRLTVQAGR